MMWVVRAKHIALMVVAMGLVGCATVKTPTPEDPLEGLNRTVFRFNDTVDRYALKPVAQAYQWAVPQPVRTSVTSFFSNIDDIYIAANELVQLKVADGVGDIMRVVINTVFGVGGLFDVATLAKLPKHQADFGITLGHYGVPPGPYLVLPLLGPSTVRDTAGLIVDYYGDPLSYVQPLSVSWALYGIDLVNIRANLLSTGDLLAVAALDKYSFIRNAYLQRRRFLISGSDSTASLPAYDASLPKYDDSDASDTPPSASSAPAHPALPAKASAASGASAASDVSAASAPALAPPAPASATLGGPQLIPFQRYMPPPPQDTGIIFRLFH